MKEATIARAIAISITLSHSDRRRRGPPLQPRAKAFTLLALKQKAPM